MATTTYEDILNKSWDEIPEERLLPAGPWRLKCRGASHKPAKGDGNPSIMFIYEALEPLEGVSDDELAELGPDYDYKSNRIFHRFWIEGNNDLRIVKRHVEKHGVDVTGMTGQEILKAVRGKSIVGIVGQRSFTRNDGSVGEENVIQSFEVDE